MRADAGIVTTHAITDCPATPQRTALRACAAPTPTMAPVIVWVVETGMPMAVRQNERDGAAGLRAEAADRPQLGDLQAHGLHDAPAAEHGAQRDGGVAGVRITQIGGIADSAAVDAGRDQQQPMMPMVFWASLLPWPRL